MYLELLGGAPVKKNTLYNVQYILYIVHCTFVPYTHTGLVVSLVKDMKYSHLISTEDDCDSPGILNTGDRCETGAVGLEHRHLLNENLHRHRNHENYCHDDNDHHRHHHYHGNHIVIINDNHRHHYQLNNHNHHNDQARKQLGPPLAEWQS